MKLLGCCRFPLASDLFAKNTRCRDINRSGVSCKVATPQIYAINGEYKSNSKKKVDIVGSDWSGLGAAYHLCNQGFDVTVLGDGYGFGDPDDVGIHGFCYPYKNIFSLVDELGLKHFTNWLQSAQYLKEGLEVEFPVLQDRPELPAPLGILFYTQGDFDVVWCRGPVKERIFNPWMELMSMKGCRFVDRKKVTDLSFDDKTGCISYVFVTMRHTRQMKLFWLSELPQSKNSLRKVLSTREEFLKVLNLDASDLVSTKLWLGKKIRIPFARNVCSSFDDSSGCNLNDLFDEHRNSRATILQADFYHANELLPLKDEHIAPKVMSYLSKCVKDLEAARVTNVEITRFPKSLTHFFPGSYKYMMRGSTSFPNLFMAGDWIITRHGSWSHVLSLCSGLRVWLWLFLKCFSS